jgi:DNA-binding response OmpR family regulator
MIAIAINDEPPALSIIERFCAENEMIDLKKTFTNAAEAIKYLKRYPVDLMFIDIQMPGYNGVEMYKSLDCKPMVIFTTAFSEYAVEGFNVNAVDYLLKPYTKDRFRLAVQKAYDSFKTTLSGIFLRIFNFRPMLHVKESAPFLRVSGKALHKRSIAILAGMCTAYIWIDRVTAYRQTGLGHDVLCFHLTNKDSIDYFCHDLCTSNTLLNSSGIS